MGRVKQIMEIHSMIHYAAILKGEKKKNKRMLNNIVCYQLWGNI